QKAKASQTMLAIVEHIALRGQSLLSSTEYQDLKKKGFYITSISWVALHKHSPSELVEFEASFTEGREGKGFRYAVLGIYRLLAGGEHARTRQPLSRDEQSPLLTLLEQTARKVLELVKDAS